MPQSRLRSRVFADCASEIYAYKEHGKCDIALIAICREALDLLITDGPALKERGQAVMKHIDAALFQIYPHKGEADLPELVGLLEEERDILRKIESGEPVSVPELEQVMTFCQEMRYQIVLAEKGLPPHRPS
jgi:hypothetical protein